MNAFFGIGAGSITISGGQHIVPIDQWSLLIEKTQLDPLQKMAIQTRVISVVKAVQFRLTQYSIAYTILRTSTTVGSILIPSLLAFQNTATPEAINIGMWGLGLLVGFSNAFMSLFKVDKNYFSLGELLEKIESEAWMYMSLSGRYRSPIPILTLEDGSVNYHKEYFHTFIERCEYLLHKAVRAELQQSINQSNGGNIGTATVGGGGGLRDSTTWSQSVGGESAGSDLYNPLPQYRRYLQVQTQTHPHPHSKSQAQAQSQRQEQTTSRASMTSGGTSPPLTAENDSDSVRNEIVNAHLEDEQFVASNGGGASVSNIRPTSSTARNPGLGSGFY